MEEKKTAIITIRLRQETKKKLEKEAEDRSWSVSQLAERILSKYTEKSEKEEREIKETDEAKQLLEYITSTNCTKVTELVKYAIENNLMETYNLSAKTWTEVIKEIKEENENLDKDKK